MSENCGVRLSRRRRINDYSGRVMSDSLPSRPPVRRRRRFGNRGYTIVEVGITAMVMLIVIASSLVTLTAGYKAVDNARYTTLAGQILQSQMEKLRMLTWAQLTDTTSGPVASSTFTADI